MYHTGELEKSEAQWTVRVKMIDVQLLYLMKRVQRVSANAVSFDPVISVMTPHSARASSTKMGRERTAAGSNCVPPHCCNT